MNIKIIRPKEKDKEEIINLFKLTIQNTFEKEGIGQLSNEINNEVQVQIDRLNLDFTSNGKSVYYLIAKIGEKTVGTIALTNPSKIIKDNLKKELKEIKEISSVYVLPQFQSKGIGTILLNNIVKHLKSINKKHFALDSGYKNAQQYWIKKLGKPTVILKDYWNKGSHHMIWYIMLDNLKFSL